ncbi:hypothetical protein [Streptomyces sp. CNQ085]|uniref:hypothetical protein n=1 Tax=Streptomyces sp. CNQ085 TaxID=2886944 RepID=UPI001F508EB1|nr:hypothetical protein [Streptomyces sp. CNQ085]MCI0386473.1 hypothetical protein [Streptomyces sp. CNQ085]
MSQADVFVIGLDEENIETPRAVPPALECRFHPPLSVEELQHGGIPVAEPPEKACEEPDAFDGGIDAIVSYAEPDGPAIQPAKRDGRSRLTRTKSPVDDLVAPLYGSPVLVYRWPCPVNHLLN